MSDYFTTSPFRKNSISRNGEIVTRGLFHHFAVSRLFIPEGYKGETVK